LPPDQRQTVWLPDQVAPYTVGRYVDPRDRNVIHEGHVLYRREQPCTPNLAPSQGLVAPPLSYASPANGTLLIRDALTAELNQQRATSKALIEQSRLLAEQMRQFSAQTREFQDTLQQYSRVQAQLLAVTNRLQLLETQLRGGTAAQTTP
jgi:hypothetical protein